MVTCFFIYDFITKISNRLQNTQNAFQRIALPELPGH